MINIFFGLLLVFFRINLDFVDIGIIYYLTNLIGYVSIFFGIKELARENDLFNTIQPIVFFMIGHSLLFFALNISGYSPLTIALTTNFLTMLSMGSFILIMLGTFMIFFIIHLILQALGEDKSLIHQVKAVENTYHAMLVPFLLAAVSLFIFPLATKVLTALSLIAALVFLLTFYHVFLSHKKRIV